jgi:hypothetical protein
MDPITLIHLRYTGNPIQQEGHEHNSLLSRHLRKHRSKRGRIACTEIRRRLHLREQDGRVRQRGLHTTDDGLKVRTRRIDILPTQPVVGAGFDHHDTGTVTQQPFDAAQRTSGRFTTESRVHDAESHARGIELPLQDGGVGAIRIEAEPRRQRRPHDEQRGTSVIRTR